MTRALKPLFALTPTMPPFNNFNDCTLPIVATNTSKRTRLWLHKCSDHTTILHASNYTALALALYNVHSPPHLQPIDSFNARPQPGPARTTSRPARADQLESALSTMLPPDIRNTTYALILQHPDPLRTSLLATSSDVALSLAPTISCQPHLYRHEGSETESVFNLHIRSRFSVLFVPYPDRIHHFSADADG